MSLKTKLVPIIASLGAAATMAPALSSCSGGLNLETHNMLNETYYNHVIPRLPITIYDDHNGNLIEKTYLNEASIYPAILKDDLLYTFSKYVPLTKTDNTYAYTLTKYYLYVQDFDIDLEDAKGPTINFSVIIDAAGELKDGGTPFKYNGEGVDEFNLTYTFHFDKGFNFEYVSDGSSEPEHDKTFKFVMPSLTRTGFDDYNITSIALGYYKAVGSDEVKSINVNEKGNFRLVPSAIFYENLYCNIWDKHFEFMLSHYFYNVTYEIVE